MNINRLKSLPWKVIGILLLIAYFIFVAATLKRNIPLPFALDLGFGQIRMYALFVGLAIASGIFYFAWLKKSQPQFKQLDLWDLTLWIIIPGLFGARLLHVIEYWDVYRTEFSMVVAFWVGGLSVVGGMIGGLVGAYIYARRVKIDWSLLLRHLVLVWPLLHFIGRIGNYFDRTLYGFPTDLPWGMYVELPFRVVGYGASQFFHPLFLYEQILNLGIFLMLWRLTKRRVATATLVKVYAFFYLSGRFLLDFFRLEPRAIPGLTFTQLLILGLFLTVLIFGLAWQIRWRLKYNQWWTPGSK